jgi:iron complex transport system ATP-binding protein
MGPWLFFLVLKVCLTSFVYEMQKADGTSITSNLYVACAFAIVERILKTWIVGHTMADALANKNPMATTTLGLAIFWLALRYFFASHRHIVALRAGIIHTIQTVRRYHRSAVGNPNADAGGLHGNVKDIRERYGLIQRIGEKTLEIYSRIAIDVVPAFVSCGVGIYECMYRIEYPYNLFAIVFLISIDVFHTWLCRHQAVYEDALSAEYVQATTRAFSVAQETATHLETVEAFQRTPYEIARFDRMCETFRRIHNTYEIRCNYQGSLRHWVNHLVTAGVVGIVHNHLIGENQHLMIMYYTNEIRRGLDEWRVYRRHWREAQACVAALDKRRRRLADDAAPQQQQHASDTVGHRLAVTDWTGWSASDPVLVLDHIQLQLGTTTILRDIHLTMCARSFVAVLGSNGAGKTSLFRLLQRHYQPSSGTLLLPPRENVFVCQQDPHLFESGSVPYNVAYGCQAMLDAVHTVGISAQTYETFGSNVVRAAHMLEIEALASSCIATLSGGERQRIGLARVLAVVLERIQQGAANTVQLLLLDEYDSALDCRGRQLAHAVISHIRRCTPCITMCITHVPLYQPHPHDEAIILRAGRIAQRGSYTSIWHNHSGAGTTEPPTQKKIN